MHDEKDKTSRKPSTTDDDADDAISSPLSSHDGEIARVTS
jgi:hypothetical protein